MPKLKILFISHSSYLFGAENCALSLIQGLDKDRFDAAAVLPADGLFKQKLDELGVKTHVLPLEWWVKNEGRLLHTDQEIPLALDRLLRIVDEEKPDIIHSNTSVVCWGAVAAAMSGVKHVWHVHEILNGHPSLQSILPLPLLYEAVNFLTDKVVAVSDAVQDEMAGFVDSDKVRLVYNGVPYHAPENPARLRKELGASPEQQIAVTVTSLQAYKGVDNLIAAAAKACVQDERLVFAIAGSGPPEAVAALRDQVKELKLEGKVFHLGFRNDIADILAGADLFVLPSAKEAFPLVVLEAMSHGRPVVATDCGGTREMVIDGETGFVVPVKDPDALAERILEICGDKALGAAMGEKGRRRYTERFTLQHYVNAFTELYQEMPGINKPRLTSRQASLLKSFIEAYVEYLKTMRVIPKLEQELGYQKRQLAESNTLLAQKQEALLVSERERVSETQQHAEQILSLVQQIESNAQKQIAVEAQLEQKNLRQADLELKLSEASHELAAERELRGELARANELQERLAENLRQKDAELTARDGLIGQMQEELSRFEANRAELEERLTKKRTSLALLDERLGQLEEELVSAVELRTELKRDYKANEILDQDERITLIIEKIAQNRELHIQLENRVLQQSTALAGREEQIRELEESLAATEMARAELVAELSRQAAEQKERDRRIAEREEALAAAEKARAELEAKLSRQAAEQKERDQWIAELEEALAVAQKARAELEAELSQQAAEQKERDQRIAEMEEARAALDDRLKQRTVAVKDRDERIRQIEEHLVEESKRVEERMRAQEMAAQRIQSELEARLKQKTVETENLSQRIRQVQEEVLEEQERIEKFVRSQQAELASSETQRSELQQQLKQRTVELEGQQERNRQISAEIAGQSAILDENLRQKDDAIVTLGELLETTGHRLKVAEDELARLKGAREEEKRGYDQVLREKEQRIEDLLNSLSWKITGPLRKGYDLVRLRK